MKQIIVCTAIFSVLSFFIFSCKKEKYPFPCSPFEIDIVIDENVSPNAYTDSLGFIHVPYNGLNYFTFEANISKVHDDYYSNGVPLVEVKWDSDYWLIFDTLGFNLSLYSIFSQFDGSGVSIPIGDTIWYWSNDSPPTNIVGYVHSSEKEGGVSTKYSYYTRKQVLFFEAMVGDTATIYFKGFWNTDPIGKKVESLDSLRVIFE